MPRVDVSNRMQESKTYGPVSLRTERLRLQRDRELEVIRRACEALYQKLHINDLAQTGLQIALDMTGAESGAMFFFDPHTQEVQLWHSLGHYRPSALSECRGQYEMFRRIIHDGFGRLIAAERTRFQSPDAGGRIVAPLKRWNAPAIGVFDLVDRRGGWLDEADLSLLTIVSALTAGAIERACRYEFETRREIGQIVNAMEAKRTLGSSPSRPSTSGGN